MNFIQILKFLGKNIELQAVEKLLAKNSLFYPGIIISHLLKQ